MLEIPISSAPYSEGLYTIYDKTYLLRLYWNTEGDFGTIGFYTSNDEPIVKGIRITMGVNILDNYRYNDNLPETPIFVYRIDNQRLDPKQYEMGNEAHLAYYG